MKKSERRDATRLRLYEKARLFDLECEIHAAVRTGWQIG